MLVGRSAEYRISARTISRSHLRVVLEAAPGAGGGAKQLRVVANHPVFVQRSGAVNATSLGAPPMKSRYSNTERVPSRASGGAHNANPTEPEQKLPQPPTRPLSPQALHAPPRVTPFSHPFSRPSCPPLAPSRAGRDVRAAGGRRAPPAAAPRAVPLRLPLRHPRPRRRRRLRARLCRDRRDRGP
eukprot:8692738-Pyramimonas_sp.AAC.1